MNSILVLLVDELKELRQGKSVDGIFIKAAIQCLACDLQRQGKQVDLPLTLPHTDAPAA